ncbi:MAG: hypothetical protein K8J31_24665, partial [Anaerolineae bacterium]|nr:hypothetical protein [Anaerolineae bacterium]
YLVGVANTPAGWVYSGAPALPAGTQVDYNSHLAKMWQGSRGQWDYHLLFTPEPHRGLPLVQGFYVALGALAHITPFSLPLVYHLARFLLTVGMVIALWQFAAHFFDQPRERWLAVLVATVASGWSWLLLMVDPAQASAVSPIEFWLLDAFNLLGALSMPHFAAAVILQIAAVLAFERWAADEGQGRRGLVVLTLALAAESFVQPYVILLLGPLFVLLTAYHIWGTRQIWLRRALWLVIPLGIHAVLVGYQYLAMNGDPIWADFAAQNLTLSPPPIYYLLGYLPFLIPIVWAGRRLLQPRWALPLLWMLLVVGLIYAPLPTQRRYLLGVQTPLAVLAVVGWTQGVLPKLRRGYRPLATAIYVLLASLGMIGMLFANLGVARFPETSGVYYSPDEWQAIIWLRAQQADNPDGVILTTFDRAGQGSGGRVVAATGQRVYAGHWIETVSLDAKVEDLKRFYDPTTPDTWRQTFLKQMGITTIWYDEYAQALGSWNPAQADYLQPVFTSGFITIYRTQ